jgi:hypothetical protein
MPPLPVPSYPIDTRDKGEQDCEHHESHYHCHCVHAGIMDAGKSRPHDDPDAAYNDFVALLTFPWVF